MCWRTSTRPARHPGDFTADDAVEKVASELGSSGSDDVIAWRGERRYVERLLRATLETRERKTIVRPDGSYIVTGGLGGIGMVVARWLVDRGAGRVVLNGRSRPSEEQRQWLADLESRAEIVVVTGDVSTEGVAQRLVTAAEETGLPLRGVLHCGGGDRRSISPNPQQGKPGARLGAQGGRRIAAA